MVTLSEMRRMQHIYKGGLQEKATVKYSKITLRLLVLLIGKGKGIWTCCTLTFEIFK